MKNDSINSGTSDLSNMYKINFDNIENKEIQSTDPTSTSNPVPLSSNVSVPQSNIAVSATPVTQVAPTAIQEAPTVAQVAPTGTPETTTGTTEAPPTTQGTPTPPTVKVPTTNQKEELIKAYIGQNYDIIKDLKFSFPAFFIPGGYLIYRKLYLLAFIEILITNLLLALSISVNPVTFIVSCSFLLLIRLLFGIFFPKVYRNMSKEKAEEIQKKYPNYQEAIKECKKVGGVASIDRLIILFIVFSIIGNGSRILLSQHTDVKTIFTKYMIGTERKYYPDTHTISYNIYNMSNRNFHNVDLTIILKDANKNTIGTCPAVVNINAREYVRIYENCEITGDESTIYLENTVIKIKSIDGKKVGK